MAEPQEYEIDGARELIDLSWSQRAPQIQPYDVDRDLRYSQYPYQEDDEYKDDEEEMEVDERAPGKTGSIRMSAPKSTQCSYCRPEATYSYPRPDQTLGSPRSIHTDTDMAMELGAWVWAPAGREPIWPCPGGKHHQNNPECSQCQI